MNNKEIQQQAKQLLDKFAKSLEKIEKQSHSNDAIPFVDREQSEREESPQPKTKDSTFKKRILENAPQSNEDFILTERGNWK